MSTCRRCLPPALQSRHPDRPLAPPPARFARILRLLAYAPVFSQPRPHPHLRAQAWEESDPRYIANSDEVKLRSFTTKVHKVDTMVSYKADM